MKWLVVFAAGYALGARASAQDRGELVRSLEAVARSEELKRLVGAVGNHTAKTLRELAELAEEPFAEGGPADDLLTRLRTLVGP